MFGTNSTEKCPQIILGPNVMITTESACDTQTLPLQQREDC